MELELLPFRCIHSALSFAVTHTCSDALYTKGRRRNSATLAQVGRGLYKSRTWVAQNCEDCQVRVITRTSHSEHSVRYGL
jgi:hypothetical protein